MCDKGQVRCSVHIAHMHDASESRAANTYLHNVHGVPVPSHLELPLMLCSTAECQTHTALGAGELEWPRCTPAYAPPDMVVAVQVDRDVVVSPAQDMWSLGLMAYEAIVGAVLQTSRSKVEDYVSGTMPYPWELPADAQPATWRHSHLRDVLAPCLARDPAARPSASVVLDALSQCCQGAQ